MGCVIVFKNVKRRQSSGMTLMELMVAVLLLLPILTVVMQNFITCVHLNASAEGTSKATWQERTTMSAIEKTPFSDIYDTYHNKKFAIAGLNGYVVTYVTQTAADLLTIHISATWKDRMGRYNGEDVNYNGQLDTGEDKNNNGRLDSNVGFSTFIYNKG